MIISEAFDPVMLIRDWKTFLSRKDFYETHYDFNYFIEYCWVDGEQPW